MMPNASEKELILESPESAFSLSAMETPQRIKELSPNAKAIVVLCNPADRVLLDFNVEASTDYFLMLFEYLQGDIVPLCWKLT